MLNYRLLNGNQDNKIINLKKEFVLNFRQSQKKIKN